MKKPRYIFKSNTVLHTHKRMQLSEDIVELPNGTQTGYLRYDNLPDAATLLVKNTEGKFLLLNEYTYPTDEYLYQMPGGAVDTDESPLEAAKRELLEETGYIATTYEYLGYTLQDHRRSLAKLHLYLVTDLTKTNHQREEHEFIEPLWFTLEELATIINTGELIHPGSMSAWGFYLNKYFIVKP